MVMVVVVVVKLVVVVTLTVVVVVMVVFAVVVVVVVMMMMTTKPTILHMYKCKLNANKNSLNKQHSYTLFKIFLEKLYKLHL